MKNFLLIVLVFSILISFSACGNAEIDNRVNLPIKGHFSVKGDIIVETDKISVTDDVIPNAQAFTYKDGEFYKLKRYETEIIVPKKYTVYGEYYGNDVNLKIQYFINNSTVYAYSNIDRKEMGNFIDIISIPQNDDSVIIQGSEILPIYVNLKNGKITPVFDSKKQGFDMSASVSCISEDGKYAVIRGTSLGEKVQESYIISLTKFEITKIPMPTYNKEFYELKHYYPS